MGGTLIRAECLEYEKGAENEVRKASSSVLKDLG